MSFAKTKTLQRIITSIEDTPARESVSTTSFEVSRTVADELLMEEIHVRF